MTFSSLGNSPSSAVTVPIVRLLHAATSALGSGLLATAAEAFCEAAMFLFYITKIYTQKLFKYILPYTLAWS
jgi:hypothetical protein